MAVKDGPQEEARFYLLKSSEHVEFEWSGTLEMPDTFEKPTVICQTLLRTWSPWVRRWRKPEMPWLPGFFDGVMVGSMNSNTSTTEDHVQDADASQRSFSGNLDSKQMPDACGSRFQNFLKITGPAAPTISPGMTMKSGTLSSPVNFVASKPRGHAR